MKKLFLVAAFAGLILLGCSKEGYDKNGLSAGKGAVSIGLESKGEFTQVKSEGVEVGDFFVEIVKGETVVKRFEKYSEVPNSVEIAPGTYTIAAGSHGNDPAAFNQPVFLGSGEFTVTAGRVVPVNITCTLQNMKVTLKYTEAFGREIADNFEIAVSNGTGNLLFTKSVIDNGSSGYFSPGSLSIKLNGTRKSTGEEILHSIDIPDGKAQDHFVLTFDAQETGDIEFGENGNPGITVDYTVNNREVEIIIPGVDETPVPDDGEGGGSGDGGDGGNGDGGNGGDGEGGEGGEGGQPANEYLPTITGDGIGTPKQISMSANNDNMVVDIHIATLNNKTIKDILVTITSTPSSFQDLVGLLFPTLSGTFSIVDFSDANGAERKNVLGPVTASNPDGLGLIANPDTDPIAGKSSYTFSIGQFMGALASTGLEAGTVCNFTMKVVDSEDKETVATCAIVMVE